MPEFNGVAPDPCSACKSQDHLRFFRLEPEVDEVEVRRTAQKEIRIPRRSPAKALFECTADGHLVTIEVPSGWTPPSKS